MPSWDAIATLLAQRGSLPEPVLRKLAREAKGTASFLSAVSAQGVKEPELVAAVASSLGIPGVDLSRTRIDLDVLDSVPRVVAEADLVLPLSTEGGRLHVALSAAAEDHAVLDELHFITGLEISPYAALPRPLENAIALAYEARSRGERFYRGAALGPESAGGVAVVEASGSRLLSGPTTDEVRDAAEELDELEVEVGVDDDPDAEVLHSVEVRTGPPKLLAVDDDPDILRLVDKTLRSAGYTVELARDGREAEQKLNANRYDLVLLDAMLPFVHGFELCSRVKASPKTRRTPVVLMTAIYRGWRYAHDARSTFGADDYIEKPFHLPDLLERVKAQLAGSGTPAPVDDAGQLCQEGLAHLEAGRFPEARKVLEAATRKQPLSPKTHLALARTMEKQGELFHAISEYERAVELRPALYTALKALAALYEQKGFRRKAVEALERAVHAAPDPATRDRLRKQLIQLI